MEKIYQTAMNCVGRAVMFSTIAISLIMLSFAFDPAAAFKAGGMLGLVLAAVLLWHAQTIHNKKPKDTETWVLLTEDTRPIGDHGARLFASVMEDVYLYFATRAFIGAIALLVTGLLLAAFGIKPTFA